MLQVYFIEVLQQLANFKAYHFLNLAILQIVVIYAYKMINIWTRNLAASNLSALNIVVFIYVWKQVDVTCEEMKLIRSASRYQTKNKWNSYRDEVFHF